MRRPPLSQTKRPPGVSLSREEEEETTAPGSQNAGLGLAQALSTWPVARRDDQTPPPGWDPTQRQLIDNRFVEEDVQRAQTEPQRGRLWGVARFLRRLRVLPARQSSRGGDQSGQ